MLALAKRTLRATRVGRSKAFSLWSFALAVALCLANPVAGAGPALDVSTAGLGDAKFGMDVDAVERALGTSLTLNKGNSKGQVRKMDCSYASLRDLAGVDLRFERGRFMAVYVRKPVVATRSGFKVGDPEQVVVDKLKADPTYQRGSNHYDDTIKEIVVGKMSSQGLGSNRKVVGQIIKFTSKKGRITEIQAGDAAWVSLFEQEEACDE